MNGKLNAIASRVYNLLKKAKIRYSGKDIEFYFDAFDRIMEKVPYRIREKILQKVNRIESKKTF
jgi:myo-inositol-1-phosphate synthase